MSFTIVFVSDLEIVLQIMSGIHTTFRKYLPLTMALYATNSSLIFSCTVNLSNKSAGLVASVKVSFSVSLGY